MGHPAARRNDHVVATDTHLIIPPPPAPPFPIAVPHPFRGVIDNGLSRNVRINGQPAATVGSTATNTPRHVPIGGSFLRPPSNRGSITQGSTTVRINGRPAARAGDTATTCNDPVDEPVGHVVAVSTVLIGS
jgi:uncharacterized Zn-binding protein involved in type VI secretion